MKIKGAFKLPFRATFRRKISSIFEQMTIDFINSGI